jgi:YCII-related domain
VTRFLLLYTGPPPAVAPSHEGWPEWFANVGNALVDRGSPMRNGFILHPDGSTSDATGPPLGYSIIQAADRARALELLTDHPLWRSGMEYAIEVFELPDR